MAVLQVMVRLAGAVGRQDDRKQGLPVWVLQLRMTDVEVDSRRGPGIRYRLWCRTMRGLAMSCRPGRCTYGSLGYGDRSNPVDCG
ncbi:MAG: hypothetical protein WBN83_11030 [Desulfoprunum sp.]|jgi:hypothetical protein|uniref:hypothetical protein n=1 Tax=Desulfoprunum sp. TaxID=2020866 RepID=UPI0026863D9F